MNEEARAICASLLKVNADRCEALEEQVKRDPGIHKEAEGIVKAILALAEAVRIQTQVQMWGEGSPGGQ